MIQVLCETPFGAEQFWRNNDEISISRKFPNVTRGASLLVRLRLHVIVETGCFKPGEFSFRNLQFQSDFHEGT